MLGCVERRGLPGESYLAPLLASQVEGEIESELPVGLAIEGALDVIMPHILHPRL